MSKAYQKTYHKQWYEKNKVARKEQIIQREKGIRCWFQEFKRTLKCSRCPENHPACLDFHHRDPAKKSFNISTAVTDGWGINRILEEVAKCIVLCKNCHAKEHSGL